MDFGQPMNALQTRKILEQQLRSSSCIQLISAFFTAYEWIDEACLRKKPKMVMRGLASDFVGGASSIKAVTSALENGWEVRFLFSLHAKVYAFDQVVVVGSGNLTAKGLNLLDESGNYEYNVALQRTPQTDEVTNNVFQLSTNIDLETALEMEKFVDAQKQKESSSSACVWPSELLVVAPRQLLFADFPNVPYGSGECPINEPWATVFRNLQSGNIEGAAQLVRESASFIWLCDTLKRNGNKLSFGGVSAALHSDIIEDTRVYRRSVKDTLTNFVSFLSALAIPEVEISTPRYRQVFVLKS